MLKAPGSFDEADDIRIPNFIRTVLKMDSNTGTYKNFGSNIPTQQQKRTVAQIQQQVESMDIDEPQSFTEKKYNIPQPKYTSLDQGTLFQSKPDTSDIKYVTVQKKPYI